MTHYKRRPNADTLRLGFLPAQNMARKRGTFSRTRVNRRSKRRRYGRRRNYRLPLFQPYTTYRRLRTVFANSYQLSANNLDGNMLKLNSVFDPTGNVNALQPMGFNILEQQYQKYTVVSYKVTIEAVSLDNTAPVAVGFCPTRESTLQGTYLQYKETQGNVTRVMTPDQDKIVFQNAGSIKKWMLPPRSSIYSDDLLSAVVTADPSRILYGHVYVQALDTTEDLGSVRLLCTIDQVVRFYEPKHQPRSS